VEKLYKKILHEIDSKALVIFLALFVVALYLRFYNIEYFQPFGWDQARDAWNVRDILMGKLLVVGPRTGIGEMHLGPLYYYALVPFFYLTKMDPIATIYFNFLSNVANFLILFYVTKKIFGNYAALFVIFVYSFSNYIITINQVPWNVTLMPGIAAAIFYSIVRIYQEDYKWVFVMWGLSGFYFNLHFTAIFLPFINIASLAFVKNKKKVLKYSLLSLPIFLIWYLPALTYLLRTTDESDNLKHFVRDYFIGFHFRFFLEKRLTDAFIQFKTVLFFPLLKSLHLLVPAIYGILILFEKDKWNRTLGYLILLWFIIPALAFTAYGGPLSEYYFLYTVPMVLYILVYLQAKILKTKFKHIALLGFSIFWIFYAWQNTSHMWIKPTSGGLDSIREETRSLIEQNRKVQFGIGDIKSYLYQIWAIDKNTK
jgi:4-amino-4-deoxy-L-arabinose transferase-like glycosyltransferase